MGGTGRKFRVVQSLPLKSGVRLPRGDRLSVSEHLTESNSIGTWYDEEADVTYLDITAVVVEKREGLTLGSLYNQKGIYDLGAGEEIPTGGTGKEPEDASPDVDRLPLQELRQRKRNDDTSR